MSSTYTTSLTLTQIGNGEQSGTWGTTTNTNWQLIEDSVAGVAQVTVSGSTGATLSVANGTTDQSRNAVIVVTGSISTSVAIVAPLVKKVYIISNQTSGGFAITIGATTGSTVSIANGLTTLVYCDGTNFFAGITGFTGGNLNITGTISATGTITGANFATSGGVPQLAGGATGQIPYQTGANATGYTPAPTTGSYLTWNGSAYAWSTGSVTTATNLAGGSANSVPYQTSAGNTSFLTPSGSTPLTLQYNGSTLNWAAAGAVSSFSGGTTGLTPNVPTTGSIVLAGTLATANGGTGATTLAGAGIATLGGSNSFAGSLLPTATSTYNLGSATYTWNNLYAQGINNGQTGNNLGGLNLAAGAVALNFSQYTSLFGNSGGISVAVDNGASGYRVPLSIGNSGKTTSIGGAAVGTPTWSLLTSTHNIGTNGIAIVADATEYAGSTAIACQVNATSSNMLSFFYGALGSGSVVGTVTTNGSSVAYNTTSDYRLKENVQPLAGAVSRVKALRPVTYSWIGTETTGEGFIAHELQAVVPDAVNGEKDAVDEDGKIKPQAIDPSKIVATLTAALQEAIARIEVLEAKVGA